MSTVSILTTIFGSIGGASIISGLITALILRRIGKMEKKLDKQEQARIDESVVIIKGIKAIGHLAEATAISQRDGKTNGEMKKALEYYEKSRDALNDYLTGNSAARTHSRQ